MGVISSLIISFWSFQAKNKHRIENTPLKNNLNVFVVFVNKVMLIGASLLKTIIKYQNTLI